MTSTTEQNKKKDTFYFLLGIILTACLIQAAGWIKNDRLVFPDVGEILLALVRLLGKRQTYVQILTALIHLAEVIALSSAFGLVIGVAEGFSDALRLIMKPMMIMLRSIPMIVMVVIVMVLTKYDRVPLIASSLFLIPLISEAACEGIRWMDQDLIDVYRMESGFNLLVFSNVHLPLMAGYLKQAYISAVGMGLKLVVSTEYLVQTKHSLGKAIHSSSYFNEYQDIYAYALIMIFMVLLLGELPLWIMKMASGQHKESASGN
ncbi:MAG: ABC transporter permease subunit [Lachnospiraceae bacterium]|nr:ABC transporter permease subunit [Lachnospiraceae bacterium]